MSDDSARAWDMVRAILTLDTSEAHVSELAIQKVLTAWALHVNPKRDGGRLRWSASTATIAAESHVNIRTVQRVLAEAIRLEWVRVDEKGIRNGRGRADGTPRDTRPTWWEFILPLNSGDRNGDATINEPRDTACVTDTQRQCDSDDGQGVATMPPIGPLVATVEQVSDDKSDDSGDSREVEPAAINSKKETQKRNSVTPCRFCCGPLLEYEELTGTCSACELENVRKFGRETFANLPEKRPTPVEPVLFESRKKSA